MPLLHSRPSKAQGPAYSQQQDFGGHRVEGSSRQFLQSHGFGSQDQFDGCSQRAHETEHRKGADIERHQLLHEAGEARIPAQTQRNLFKGLSTRGCDLKAQSPSSSTLRTWRGASLEPRQVRATNPKSSAFERSPCWFQRQLELLRFTLITTSMIQKASATLRMKSLELRAATAKSSAFARADGCSNSGRRFSRGS